MELLGLRRRKWNQQRRRGCGEYHRGIIVKVTSERVINAGPGCFCQPVRWLECLMFSLLVALLCIFLCQRRGAIWTARALQRPAGSSVFLLTPPVFSLSWVPLICYDLRASWQTNLPLKKGKKNHEPISYFVVHRKHRCSWNGWGMGDGVGGGVAGDVTGGWRLTVASSD